MIMLHVEFIAISKHWSSTYNYISIPIPLQLKNEQYLVKIVFFLQLFGEKRFHELSPAYSELSLQEKERQALKDEKIRQMAMAQKQKMAQKNEQRLRLRA